MIQLYLFKTGWYVISLILFFVSLAFGPLVLAPKVRPVKTLLKEYQGEDIPNEYYVHSERLFFYERITNLFFLIIIVLMITKPF